jgi:ribulose-5-phosphate 4-epimerase/fuculose-1-phosphate aldolase
VREPRPGPGIGRELTVPEQLACALRILADQGWRENLDGHISWSTPDGGMWMNPWGVWWDEVGASQILRLDADGNVVEGDWDVTGAVALHTELHRARPDATIVVHNHPYYAALLSAMGELPRMVHQNSCVFHDELAFVDEYALVEGEAEGQWLADHVGNASGVLLAHHGAIVTASTISDACYRAATFERMCRFTYDILAAGRTPVEISPEQRGPLKKLLDEVTGRAYWEGAVRTLIAREPEVLE